MYLGLTLDLELEQCAQHTHTHHGQWKLGARHSPLLFQEKIKTVTYVSTLYVATYVHM